MEYGNAHTVRTKNTYRTGNQVYRCTVTLSQSDACEMIIEEGKVSRHG